MMKFGENEDAVSPVIGVILMVAITVILAAVIAAFVFGMAGNVQSTKSVHAIATHTVDAGGYPIIIVTFTGGPDAGLVESLDVKVNGKKAFNSTGEVDLGVETGSSVTILNTTDKVGEAGSEAIEKGKTNHVIVTAAFADGTSQVILDAII